MSKHFNTVIIGVLLVIVIILITTSDSSTPQYVAVPPDGKNHVLQQTDPDTLKKVADLETRLNSMAIELKLRKEYHSRELEMIRQQMATDKKNRAQAETKAPTPSTINPNQKILDELQRIRRENEKIKMQLTEAKNRIGQKNVIPENPNDRPLPDTIDPKEAARLKAKLERDAYASFSIIQTKVKKYLNTKNYSGVYFQMGLFSNSYLNTSAGKKYLALKEDVNKVVTDDYNNQITIVNEYVKSSEYTLAIDHLNTIRPLFISDEPISKKINKKLSDLRLEYDKLLTSPIPSDRPKDQEGKVIPKSYKIYVEQLGSEDRLSLKSARKSLQDAGMKAVKDLITGSEHNNISIRRNCVILLGQLKIHNDKSAVQTLISALRDSETTVVHAALDALIKVKPYSCIEEVTKLVESKNFDNGVATKAIKTFEKITAFEIPASKYATKNNLTDIQGNMKLYWNKNKKKYLKN